MQNEQILLFYSDHCFFCQQILQELERQNVANKVVRVSIDLLRAKGKQVPPKIHSVPAVMVLPYKTTYFGKEVFDYLLNLQTGKIRELNKTGKGNGFSPEQAQEATLTNSVDINDGNIHPHSLSGSHFSDQFTFLSGADGFDSHGTNDQISYAFTNILDSSASNETATPQGLTEGDLSMAQGTKVKKTIPNYDDIRNRRLDEEKLFMGPGLNNGSAGAPPPPMPTKT